MYSEKVRAELLGGALADHKTHYAGYCQGYYMTFVPQADGYRVTVNASLPADPVGGGAESAGGPAAT